ncbi:hypothetical protein ACNHKD_10545 [Methylocystis sp. JAN1]
MARSGARNAAIFSCLPILVPARTAQLGDKHFDARLKGWLKAPA